jgi:hypothetical protein
MRAILLLPIAMFLLSFTTHHNESSLITTDTVIISHKLDGLVDEWPGEKFETDAGTKIKYAVDNDEQNLYVAMVVAEFPTQMKMMKMGMNLFVDVKGKKKENRGIEFPVRSDQTSFAANNSSNTRTDQADNENGKQTFDKKAIRSHLVMNLIYLRLFGFSDDGSEPVKQGIEQSGSVNIQFTWDSTDVMLIEYSIPLNLITSESLDKKTISVGWKLNEMNPSNSNSNSPELTGSTARIVGVPAGTRNNSRGNFGNNSSSNTSTQQNRENFTKEESFWTKYTVNIPPK